MTTSPIPLIYIAGPFRGPTPLDVRRHVEAARDLGLRVAQCGGYPMIPHTMTAEFDKQLTDQFWLDGTMEMLTRCDAIVMSWDWETSSGARAELAQALAIPLPIHYDIRSGAQMSDAWIRRDLQSFIDGVRADKGWQHPV